jgi:hypothetical protein
MIRSRVSKAAMLVAAVHLAAITAPSVAWAQNASSGPQPVPYGTAPVPYGQSSTSTPPAPGAHAAGGDVIYLKNGGILRGTIIDAIPNAQARIQLATGEIATVPWQQINRIEHATEQPRPSPSAAPAPAAAKPATQASMVWVHIEGPEDVHLQQDTTGDDDWETVCTAPCDKQLPTAYYYRVTGSGIKASREFTLHAQPGGHETLNVNGASKAWFIIGVIALPAGLVVGYIGLIVGLVGSAAKSVDQSTGATTTSQNNASDVAGVGWTMFGVGVAAAIGGLVLLIANWKTGVSQDISSQTGSIAPSDAWKRLPTWKEAGPEQRAMPTAVGIPVFSGTF